METGSELAGGKCWVEGVIESQGRQWIVLVE